MSSHLTKLSRAALRPTAVAAASLTAASGVATRRFMTNATASTSTSAPAIVVANGGVAPDAASQVSPIPETATLHVPVASRSKEATIAAQPGARQLRRHVTTIRTHLRPLSTTPWDILAADQDTQIATQRSLLVRSYRSMLRRAVALHRLLKLNQTVPMAVPPGLDLDETLELLQVDAFQRHISPLVLGVFTGLVDPKALCCLLAPRAEMRFANAITALVDAESTLALFDLEVAASATAQQQPASASPKGSRGKRPAVTTLAAAPSTESGSDAAAVAAGARAALVADVNAKSARLVHEVVGALYRWQEVLAASGHVPTHGAVRRAEASRDLASVESEFKSLVSAREAITRRVSMRMTAPGVEVNTSREENETDEQFEVRDQRRATLAHAKVRHGTRRLVEAHDALQTSLEAMKRMAIFHSTIAQTMDPAKIIPAGSPYQFSNTEVAENVAETFRQTQLEVKRALNASSSDNATIAASSDAAVSAPDDSVAARLQVLLARAAQNKRDREARAAGLASIEPASTTTPSVYSENGYDFWSVPAVQTTVSSVVEAAPLALLSKAMRTADVAVAYWPTEVDREDDVAGARAAEQNKVKAARAAAPTGAAAPAPKAPAAPAKIVAPLDASEESVLDAASRVSILAGLAAGTEPLFMRTHVNKFRRLPLPYELVQAASQHMDCELEELTTNRLRRRAATTAGRAPGAPVKVSKAMAMPPLSTTTSSVVDFGPAAVNLGGGISMPARRRPAPEELEVRLATRCDEALRSAAPHNGSVTQEESDALADWGITRAPTDAAADIAAAEMLRQQAQAAGRPVSAVRAAGKSSSSRRVTLQPTSDGVMTASARAMSMNRRQTRAAMDAAATGESAENCFFRALLPGASTSAVSDATQMMRFRYRVEMRNHSKTHALLMLSRRWQFIGCSGMREVVGPGFAGSCPLILPGSSHTYESSAFVPLVAPSPQQLQARELASPGLRRAALAAVAATVNAGSSSPRLLGVPSSPSSSTSSDAVIPATSTSASFRQLEDFAAHSDGTVFAAAAQHAREFGATIGWMQGAFQFVAVPAEATFSEEGLTLLRNQADRAAGGSNNGGAASPGAGPAAFKKFLRRFYGSGVADAAKGLPPPCVSHVKIVPTALDPFMDQYATLP